MSLNYFDPQKVLDHVGEYHCCAALLWTLSGMREEWRAPAMRTAHETQSTVFFDFRFPPFSPRGESCVIHPTPKNLKILTDFLQSRIVPKSTSIRLDRSADGKYVAQLEGEKERSFQLSGSDPDIVRAMYLLSLIHGAYVPLEYPDVEALHESLQLSMS